MDVRQGDNLAIMREMKDDSVDLIYLDPPFNKGTKFKNRGGRQFNDRFDYDMVSAEWVSKVADYSNALEDYIEFMLWHGKESRYAYLMFMAMRLIECKRLLKEGGALYYHCDDSEVYYIKQLLDLILGEKAFGNHIVWKRTSTHSQATRFARVADHILFYGPPIDVDAVRVPLSEAVIQKSYRYRDERGQYAVSSILQTHITGGNGYYYDANGHPGPWCYTEEWYKNALAENRIHFPKGGGKPCAKYYLKENKGVVLGNIWTDIFNVKGGAKELQHYPTQKPLALLNRIILASSKEGDVVLDPFCGCGTTIIAANNLGRYGVGIDKSEDAVRITWERIDSQTLSLPLPAPRKRCDLPS